MPYLHTLDPVALEIFGWKLRFYPLTYALGFVVGYLILRWLSKAKRSLIEAPRLGDVAAYIVFSVAVGARLGYVLFYRPELLVDFSSSFPFWGVLAFHKGGMSSHGGMLGVMAACFYIRKEQGVPVLHLFDIMALACPPGLAFGRIGNLINAELWGKPLPEASQPAAGGDAPWWSIQYPQELTSEGFDVGRLYGVQDRMMEHLYLPPDTPTPELLEVLERSLVGGDDVVRAAVQPLLTAHYPSPIFQAITDGPVMLALLVAVAWRPRKPGVVGAWFFMGYGALRILSEVWRQPDVGVDLLLGLSRGQLLSVLLIAAGAVGLFVVSRRDVPKLGGLAPRRRGLPPVTPPASSR